MHPCVNHVLIASRGSPALLQAAAPYLRLRLYTHRALAVSISSVQAEGGRPATFARRDVSPCIYSCMLRYGRRAYAYESRAYYACVVYTSCCRKSGCSVQAVMDATTARKRARRLAATKTTRKLSKAAVKEVESSPSRKETRATVKEAETLRRETKSPHILRSVNKRTRKDKRPLPECSSQSDRSHSSPSPEREQTHTKREEGK